MAILDNLSVIRKYDSRAMASLISRLPDDCFRAREMAAGFKPGRSYIKSYDNIVCTGLGGSAIGADIVRSYIADSCRTPLFVNRTYVLPAFVGRNSLVIACSYSGDTEETLCAYRDARRKGATIAAITSGGRLGALARADGLKVLTMPKGLPPRCALGYSVVTLLTLLSGIGIIKDQSAHLDEAVSVMKSLQRSELALAVPQNKNTAKKIASKLYRRYPVIYGAEERLDAVVTRWRGQLAENAKTLASSHLLPEMNHNEIVGWDNPAKVLKEFAVVMLRDKGDYPRLSRRIDITERIIGRRCCGITEVSSSGKGLLARIFSLVHIGDFVSLYLAVLNKCDPTPVERIVYLKKELAKKR